jgi:xanthine dehydrogenase accessory factor
VTTQGTIWIQGAGELASGVAVRLVRSGYRVVLAETEKPLAVRRLVSFSEAVYAGRAEVEGIAGHLVGPGALSFAAGRVEVVVDPEGFHLASHQPAAVVDARMTKKSPEPLPSGQAPLIGLGPGFTCGRDADLIIETHREARLGTVISRGSAAPNTGVAGLLGGQTSRRVLRSPANGRLTPLCAIGDLLDEGTVVGHVQGLPVVTRLKGLVRGLIHPEAELSQGMKVGDVDPRGQRIDPSLVSDKALAVGGGVLEALLRLNILRD